MIRCNLSILLAERNLKITQVSKDTGISRTTLTSLSNNYSQGIQFDTVNTLCNYLRINPEQLISYIPIDIDLYFNSFECSYNEFNFIIDLLISEKGKKYNCSFPVTCYLGYDSDNKIDSIDICLDLFVADDDDDDAKIENSIIINSFKKLPITFLNDIESKIIDEVIRYIDDEKEISEPLKTSFYWDNILSS